MCQWFQPGRQAAHVDSCKLEAVGRCKHPECRKRICTQHGGTCAACSTGPFCPDHLPEKCHSCPRAPSTPPRASASAKVEPNITTGRWVDAKEFDRKAKELEERAAEEMRQFREKLTAAAESRHTEVMHQVQMQEAHARQASQAQAQERINELLKENELQQRLHEKEKQAMKESLDREREDVEKKIQKEVLRRQGASDNDQCPAPSDHTEKPGDGNLPDRHDPKRKTSERKIEPQPQKMTAKRTSNKSQNDMPSGDGTPEHYAIMTPRPRGDGARTSAGGGSHSMQRAPSGGVAQAATAAASMARQLPKTADISIAVRTAGHVLSVTPENRKGMLKEEDFF